jgi:chorismate lyase / 3-hydroxybenzoate synthase
VTVSSDCQALLPVPLDGDAPLLAMRFAGVDGVACTPLAGSVAGECWQSRGPMQALASDRVQARIGAQLAAWSLSLDEPDLDPERAAEQAYRALLAAVRPSSHPYLIRIWNYFGAINAGAGDAERYRRFCVGRARAADAMFGDPPPAATAIGTVGDPGRLQLFALSSRRPGIALENPRQTPAWQYPREYGPVSPGFSRGAVLELPQRAVLLASGTASIVGHVSKHAGDSQAQLDESLANLAVLLEEGERRSGHRFALAQALALRVYLRHPEDAEACRARLLAAGLPERALLLLQGDVCRRELRLELEGVFPAVD